MRHRLSTWNDWITFSLGFVLGYLGLGALSLIATWACSQSRACNPSDQQCILVPLIKNTRWPCYGTDALTRHQRKTSNN